MTEAELRKRERSRVRRREWRKTHPEESMAMLMAWKEKNKNRKRPSKTSGPLPLFLYKGRDDLTLPLFDEEQIRSGRDHRNMDGEQWRVVPDYPAYEASTLGRVRNRRLMRLLRGKQQPNGYVHVGLCIIGSGKQRMFQLHRLIAMLFIPNTEGKPLVNHKDGIKSHNAVANLEWVTYSENSRHAIQLRRTKG